MIFPNPPEKFEKQYFQLLLGRLENILQFVYFRNRDILVEPNTRLILVAPNGNRYAIKVDNNGSLLTELV